MTDKKPDAQRLADEYADANATARLETYYGTSKAYTEEKVIEASEAGEALAAELQRLHAVEQQRDELLAALIGMVDYYGTASANLDELHKARAAIAQATGATQ